MLVLNTWWLGIRVVGTYQYYTVQEEITGALFSKPNGNCNNVRGQDALVIKMMTTHFLISCHAPLGSLSNTTQAPAPVNKQTVFYFSG